MTLLRGCVIAWDSVLFLVESVNDRHITVAQMCIGPTHFPKWISRPYHFQINWQCVLSMIKCEFLSKHQNCGKFVSLAVSLRALWHITSLIRSVVVLTKMNFFIFCNTMCQYMKICIIQWVNKLLKDDHSELLQDMHKLKMDGII